MNPPSNSQLLIVDDYPTNIKVLSGLLGEYGFEVLIARDGENALKKLQRIQPDLILLDILMPGMDGFETCRRIKEQATTCDIPVIFMSALSDPVDKVKGLTLGAVDYITKPFQQEEVLARVNTHLRLRRLTQQLEQQNRQLQSEMKFRQLAESALRASEEKYAKAFRANPCPIMIATLPDRRVTEVNQAFCQGLGYPPEAILNHPVLFVPPAEREALFEAVQPQQTLRDFNCVLQTATGEHRHFTMAAEVIQVKNTPCLLGMMMDMTKSHQAAEALQQARENADISNQAKTQFLANISHELRTPLNTILGYIQLMERDPALQGDQQDYLTVINRSSQHLLTLINDVLEMTRIESGQLVLNETPFQLSVLLTALYDMLEPKVLEKGLQLSFNLDSDVPSYICTDETKLRQILVNLVGNAIKFTQQGQVTLKVQCPTDRAAPAPDQIPLIFEVSDTGPGIAAEELSSLFDPFIQTETGRRLQEGTGLGLPISQRFVQFMGGDITVKSTVGQGSSFCFTLPIRRADAQDIAPEQPRRRVAGLAPHQPAYRILVVEDQAANRQLLVKLLLLVGFEVQEAVNGQDAVAMHRTWQPHLILMDMRMPVMDGIEAVRQIKQQQLTETVAPFTKIIALTAQVFEEERQAALAAGCDGFVRKPIQEANLFSSIAAQIGVEYAYQSVSSSSALPRLETPPAMSVGLKPSVLKNLDEITAGDGAFLQEYLDLHLEQMPELLRTLRQAIAQDDPAEASLAAHTLKGMGMSFEDEQVTHLARSIEQAAKEGRCALCQQWLDPLEATLEQLMTAISHTRHAIDCH